MLTNGRAGLLREERTPEYTISVPADLYDQLRALALRDRCAPSDVANRLLADGLQRQAEFAEWTE